MTVERNAAALLALVQEDAARRVNGALAAARDDAARIRREAHDAARAAVRKAYADERHRHRERVAAAQAARDTRERLALQRHNAALVAAGLAELPGALAHRWQLPQTRAAWVDRAFEQACATLPRTQWAVVHPGAWPGDEREALAARIATFTGQAPKFVEDPALPAGVAIEANGTRVDARLPGLMADRSRLGARLLYVANAGTHGGLSL
jgi:hypothetical protein